MGVYLIIYSLLAAGFFSKVHLDECLVIADGMEIWPSREEDVPRSCLVPFLFRLKTVSPHNPC